MEGLEAIIQAARDQGVHKDQVRALETYIPTMFDKAFSKDPQDLRECTVLMRCFVQGPDPLYLASTCPENFRRLCRSLSISVDVGMDAIVTAHWQGPGALLHKGGVPIDPTPYSSTPEDEVHFRREMLWILLASVSNCTKQGYGDEVTFAQRLAVAQEAAIRLHDLAVWDGKELHLRVQKELAKMRDNTTFTFDERGFPHTDKDHGFYIAYKLGHKACAVKAGTMTFWGTVPSTSLEEQGIKVDKNISPKFGIVFGKDT